MTRHEFIALPEAEELTGLPASLVVALVDSGEVCSSRFDNGTPAVAKASLLGWCRLFSRVLTAVVKRHSQELPGNTLTARSLTSIARAGLLSGRERVAL